MKSASLVALLALLVLGPACSKKVESSAKAPAGSGLAESYWLAAAPGDAKPVIEAKKAAKDGDEVVLAGRVKEWTDGFAQFTMADSTLKACSDMAEPDHCKTPWDYCCVPPEEVRAGTVTVEFRDGVDPVKATLQGFHGLDHLKQVVVKGKVEKKGDNVIVVASGLHVR